ncbi:hypothetical protein [Nonomuraea sp. B19D2]|uniref:hypothetical protein n=1 Tax=Nonomuraea sp. B19D2 TaxID=3159561 RepID=UPI0032DA8E0A
MRTRRISSPTCGARRAGRCWAGGNVYDCVTGVMPGDPPGIFKSHGHLVRVIVVTEQVTEQVTE